MDASGPDECWGGLIERFAELDGLEVPGFFIEPGFAEDVEESLDGLEKRSPVDPLWKGVRLRPGEEEAPFVMVQEGEVFFPANANGADVPGYGEIIEDVLNGATEVAGLAGDFGRVSLFIGKQPGHDFGPGLHAEERAEFEKKCGGLIRARSLAHSPEFDAAALQAVLEENRIRLLENRDGGKEPLKWLCGRRAWFFDPPEEKLPFVVVGFPGEEIGDGGENGGIAQSLVLVKTAKALEIDPGAAGVEPVEHLIEQAAVVAGDVGGEEEQGLGVDHPWIIAAGVPRHPQGGPLPPKEVEKPL